MSFLKHFNRLFFDFVKNATHEIITAISEMTTRTIIAMTGVEILESLSMTGWMVGMAGVGVEKMVGVLEAAVKNYI